jgi:hypothetical protein
VALFALLVNAAVIRDFVAFKSVLDAFGSLPRFSGLARTNHVTLTRRNCRLQRVADLSISEHYVDGRLQGFQLFFDVQRGWRRVKHVGFVSSHHTHNHKTTLTENTAF